MKEMRGTRTTENLLKAFCGESQARMRYELYAKRAKEEGYVHIAKIFQEIASSEKEHGIMFFRFLTKEFKGESILISAGYPVGCGTTMENLRYAADCEHDESVNIYPSFSADADEEGFVSVAVCFRRIAEVEAIHQERFRKLRKDIENNEVFKKNYAVEWKCGNCGYIYRGHSAPSSCPACLHDQGYFEARL